MSIANTLRDIAEESSLNKAEKVSLREIAKEYENLEATNKYLWKQLRSRVSVRIWRNIEEALKEKP